MKRHISHAERNTGLQPCQPPKRHADSVWSLSDSVVEVALAQPDKPAPDFIWKRKGPEWKDPRQEKNHV